MFKICLVCRYTLYSGLIYNNKPNRISTSILDVREYNALEFPPFLSSFLMWWVTSLKTEKLQIGYILFFANKCGLGIRRKSSIIVTVCTEVNSSTCTQHLREWRTFNRKKYTCNTLLKVVHVQRGFWSVSSLRGVDVNLLSLYMNNFPMEALHNVL